MTFWEILSKHKHSNSDHSIGRHNLQKKTRLSKFCNGGRKLNNTQLLSPWILLFGKNGHYRLLWFHIHPLNCLALHGQKFMKIGSHRNDQKLIDNVIDRHFRDMKADQRHSARFYIIQFYRRNCFGVCRSNLVQKNGQHPTGRLSNTEISGWLQDICQQSNPCSWDSENYLRDYVWTWNETESLQNRSDAGCCEKFNESGQNRMDNTKTIEWEFPKTFVLDSWFYPAAT